MAAYHNNPLQLLFFNTKTAQINSATNTFVPKVIQKRMLFRQLAERNTWHVNHKVP